MKKISLLGALALTGMLLIPATSAEADDWNISIDSQAGWQSFDYVQTWQTIHVYAKGSWTVDYRRSEIGYTDPAGYSWAKDRHIGWQWLCHFTNDATYGTLLGKIDNGPTFVIGHDKWFVPKSSGTLWLRINDGDDCLEDNYGRVNVYDEIFDND
ncbi:MAG TPA: hypothetical protein V6C65_41715 [Allocoleopsis sp.]